MPSDSEQHADRDAQGASVAALRRQLQAMIETGPPLPGGRLPTERELSEITGVSRRTVRRALGELEADALIWRRRGKGTFAGVAPDPTQALAAEIVGETDFIEVMEARMCIEPVLAAMCAGRASPQDVERMRDLARRTAGAVGPEEMELWDGALHRLIARTAGNRPLLTAFAMLDEIRNDESWRELRARARSVETLKANDAAHRSIIDAIAAGQAEAAEAAMRGHLTILADNLRRILRARGQDEEGPAK
jgi:DNA-binding FadR family transcriptional regulator